MNKKQLEAFAREAAKTLKTEKDLSDFSQMLTKMANSTSKCDTSPTQPEPILERRPQAA